MTKIALIAAFAVASVPFAFGQNNPPAQSGANAQANGTNTEQTQTTTTGKHHKRAKAHKKAKTEKSGAANRAMPGEK
jgi:hypothetical protein